MKINKDKKKLILLSFLLVITFSGVLPFFTTYQETNTEESGIEKNPKLNAGITINSPVDGSHLEASLEGNYPGTYSFENDNDGSDPDGWTVSEPSATGVQVIDEIDSHKKVVEMYDRNENTYPYMYKPFNYEKTYGTVEWWFMQSSNVKLNQFLLKDQSEGAHINILTSFTKSQWIQIYDGSVHNICPFSSNNWYHMSVKFDIGTAGDGSNDWHLSVNGIEYGPFGYQGTPNTMDCIYFKTDYGITYNTYIDAIGFSWEPTYNFKNDDIGTNPDGWDVYEPSATSVQVIDEMGSHKKVVELYDENADTFLYMHKHFNEEKTYGTVEWWFRQRDNKKLNQFLMGDSSEGGLINILTSYDMSEWIQYHDGSPHDICSFSSNIWYHLSVKFDIGTAGDGTNDWHLSVDGTEYGPFGYQGTPNTMDYIQIKTDHGVTDYTYIDDVGFSWDPAYNIGDNIVESGYYPATYGFENDEYGANPEEWIVYEDSATSIQVIDEKDSHKKVVEIYDGNAATYPHMYTYFNDEKTFGTVEWWFRQSDNTKLNQILLGDTEGGHINILTSFTKSQWIQIYDGSVHNICPFSSNEWYHMSIKFDIGTAGDRTNDWHISVNGVEYGPFGYQGTPNTMDYIQIKTDYGITGYTYIDAVGISGESGYEVGDNLKQGMLLDFEDDDFTTMSYKLDGGANFDILGDTVIPYPISGSHTIEVFGGGYSGLSQFLIGDFNINSLVEGETYYSPPEIGYYPATYGFENDENGAVPKHWSGGKIEDYKEDYKEKHKKVMHLQSVGPVAGSENRFYLQEPNQMEPTSGTIEFWWFATNTDPNGQYDQFTLRTKNTAYQLILTVLNGHLIGCGKILYSNFINQWHHVRIDFARLNADIDGIEDDTYLEVRIDGVIKGSTTNIDLVGVGIIYMYEYSGRESWYDAFGFSWRDGYKVGDNWKEGLYIDFEPDNFETMSYQLNKRPKVNILGDFVIPMYYGVHTLQIYGNGEKFSSEVRTFRVNSNPGMGLIVPWIDYWDDTAAAANEVPVIAILGHHDTDVYDLMESTKYGNVIRYVSTRKQGDPYEDNKHIRRVIDEVENEIDIIYNYPDKPDGIFLDNFAAGEIIGECTPEAYSYYSYIYSYIKAYDPNAIIVGNVHADLEEGFFDCADIFNIYESYESSIDAWNPPGWIDNYALESFSGIVHDCTGVIKMKNAISTMYHNHDLGWIYVTDDIFILNVESPYDNLPTFWQDEYSFLKIDSELYY